MISDDKLLLDKTEDLFRKCRKYAKPVFSSFNNENEQVLICDNAEYDSSCNTMFFGGYDNASRKIYGVFPEWEEASADEFPICIIKVCHKFGGRLTHRDYLGAALGIGIERCKIGDILVFDDCAYVFVCRDIADYIVCELKKIGNRGVKCSICGIDEVRIPKQEFETISCTAASLRLDAVLAACLNVSRSVSSKLVSGECVCVNHRLTDNISFGIKKGDVLSVKGFGRYILDDVGNNTRSGRIHIVVLKYV